MSDQIERGRRWFAAYADRLQQGVSRSALPGVRYPCPCCGYLTLSERGSYLICELCNWEDDGQDDPHADEVWGGPNGAYALSEARANFRQHLIMYRPDAHRQRIGGGDSSLELEAKRAIMAAFDAMVGEGDPAIVAQLWQQVYAHEEILSGELHRKVREHDARHRTDGAPGDT